MILACFLSGCGAGGGDNTDSNSTTENASKAIAENKSIKKLYCQSSASPFPLAHTSISDNVEAAAGPQLGAQALSELEYSDKSQNSEPCQDSDFCVSLKTNSETDGVLTNIYSCNEFVNMRAQDMTDSEFAHSCQLLSAQEAYFHQRLNTGYAPLANDYNETLEVVVFNDSDEYDQYGASLFGINTDNGGIYVEGTPSRADNQARLFTYEASWMRPGFKIWNLTHEYVHYLDARFNLLGGFADNHTETHKTVWWIEGLAEYLSKRDHNAKAIAVARTRAYSLSEVFANTYEDDSERVYRWGYLAVRFMFERYPSHIEQILTYFRAGNFDAYLDFIDNTLGTDYDNEWYDWLGEVENDTGEPVALGNTEEVITENLDGGYMHYYIDVPADKDVLKITLNGGYGNADLHARLGEKPSDLYNDCYSKGDGNNEICEILAPEEGRWFIRLKAASPYTDVRLKASYGPGVAEQAPAQTDTLGNGEIVSEIATFNQCDELVYYIDVPPNASNLQVITSGGSGDADLYVGLDTETYSDAYDCRSEATDNDESCTIANPPAGRWYLKLTANSVFEDLSLMASYDAG